MGNENGIKLFQEKKYAEALAIYDSLLQQQPTDTSLFYYQGVCLTETGQYGTRALNFLLSSTVDNTTYDINFFIGKNFHALNNFTTAKNYYLMFNERASKKERKSFDVDRLIQLCEKNINPFPKPQITEETLNPGITNETTEVPPTEQAPPLQVPEQLKEAAINFVLTSDISYLRFFQFKTYNGRKNYIDGWANADALNKMTSTTDSLRMVYSKTFSSEGKSQIAAKVIDMEDAMRQKKSISDECFAKACEYELAYWGNAPEEEKWKLAAQNDSIKEAEEKKLEAELPPPPLPDTIIISSAVPDSILSDSTINESTTIIPEPQQSSKVVFKIQIGKYNTELPESAKKLFKKISVLRKIDQYTDEKNFTVYTIGELSNIKDAVKLQNQIRQESVKDAFVIAIKDGKRIPLNEALELTKE